MSDATTKLLEDRIVALIERVKLLAAERDGFMKESDAMRSRVEREERENARLRAVLEETIRELREEARP